ncbi:hypothetical protein [Nocardioides sp.]|uniref:hypothetical protein n=1 Tax=Nocardioides sp. TaxID=35761 RepID=UPI0039E2252E
MTTYTRANRTAQWFGEKYPGSRLNLTAATAVVVIHTTESMTWPDYDGGATAPNYTANPSNSEKALTFRAHFEDECSSRALRNLAGGVETNTLNAVQIELVGTCDYAKRSTWNGKTAGKDYIYWPAASDWALRDLGEFLADMHRRHGLRLHSPVAGWLAYGPDSRRPGVSPASYGASPVRLTGAEWRQFTGVCGHQHVPENVHGDPGAIDIGRVLAFASEALGDDTKEATMKAPKAVPAKWSRFAHLMPYCRNNSIRGLDAAKRAGYTAIDLDAQVCWANSSRKRRVMICTHWGTVGKEFYDPLGKIKPGTKFAALTWPEVKRLRSKDGKGFRIHKMNRMLRAATKRGLRVEVEAKGHKAFAKRPGLWRRLRTVADAVGADVQVKTLTGLGGSASARLEAAKAAGFVTIVLPRGSRRLSKTKFWPVTDYVRGPVTWVA